MSMISSPVLPFLFQPRVSLLVIDGARHTSLLGAFAHATAWMLDPQAFYRQLPRRSEVNHKDLPLESKGPPSLN